jgi:hypothetical protein
MLSNEEESDQCSVDSDPWGEGWETGIGARDLPGSPRKELELAPRPGRADSVGLYATGTPGQFNRKFPLVFHRFGGVPFPLTLQAPARLHHCSSSNARLKVLCAALSANTFLFAAPYLSRRDAGRRLGLLAL